MRSLCLDTSLRLFLAALLLTGGFSLGVRHAHRDGDRAHHHHGMGHHGMGHHGMGHHGAGHHAPEHHELGACWTTDAKASAAPRLGHSHDGDNRDGDDHQGLSSAPLHRHVFLLGFEFTFTGGTRSPDNSPPDDSNETTPVGGKDTLVRLVSDDIANVSAVTFPVAAAWEVATIASSAADLVERPLPRAGCTAAIARPLCDVARHERSGVQLI